MKGSQEQVLQCTTGQFDGAIAVLDPERSWVVSHNNNVPLACWDLELTSGRALFQAKWQRNSKHLPGVYAVRVQGQLPQDIIDDLEARGIKVKETAIHARRSGLDWLQADHRPFRHR